MNWKKTVNWNPFFTRQNGIFSHLHQLHPFTDFSDFPSIEELNQLFAPSIRNSLHNSSFCFVSPKQNQMEFNYEAQVYFFSQITTRLNYWQDFFGALIWWLFPHTKQIINQQHMADIDRFGQKERTARRDSLTHFDECGIIIAFSKKELVEQLRNHQWKEALFEQRWAWGKQINAYLFGHALYEMALHPFVGMTAKMLPVEVDDGFFQLPLAQQYILLDYLLSHQLENEDLLASRRILSPLPLLGIPNYCQENKNSSFYENTNYFRPLRSQT